MSQENTNTKETNKDSVEFVAGTPATVPSQEYVKLKCLEIAKETSKTTPDKVLIVAKEYHNWVVS